MENKSIIVIKDNCIACGTCESVCPVNAISLGGIQYEIDQTKCKGPSCSLCVGVCPVTAIVEEEVK